MMWENPVPDIRFHIFANDNQVTLAFARDLFTVVMLEMGGSVNAVRIITLYGYEVHEHKDKYKVVVMQCDYKSYLCSM